LEWNNSFEYFLWGLLVLFVVYFIAVGTIPERRMRVGIVRFSREATQELRVENALATAKKEGFKGNLGSLRRSGKTPNPNHHTPFSKSYLVHIVYPGLSSSEYTANIVSDSKAHIIDKVYKYN
jgi:hypothetical protein